MAALEFAVFVTVAASVAAWALAEGARSRALWTLAAGLMLAHSALAFAVFYDWSHTTASLETTRQTAARTGVTFAGGIYVNYVFLAVWTADVGWWWRSRSSYESRPAWVDVATRAFIFFIIANGAVVFADGWARVVGIAAVAYAAAASWRRRRATVRGTMTPALSRSTST